jgi:hypothetical protein
LRCTRRHTQTNCRRPISSPRLQAEDETARANRPAAAFDALQAERDAAIAGLLERLNEPDLLPTAYDRYFASPTAGSIQPIDRAAILNELESTPDGCAELADMWDDFLQTLDDPARPWHPRTLPRLARLLGHAGTVTSRTPEPIANPYRAALVVALARTTNPTDRSAFQTLLNQASDPTTRNNLPTADAARESLRALAHSQFERLNARLDHLWLESDAALFTEAAASAASPTGTSPDDLLRQRYLAAATRDLHRAFNLLDRGRKTARLWAATRSTDATPAPNEPKPTCHCSVSSDPHQPACQGSASTGPHHPSTPAPNEPKPKCQGSVSSGPPERSAPAPNQPKSVSPTCASPRPVRSRPPSVVHTP